MRALEGQRHCERVHEDTGNPSDTFCERSCKNTGKPATLSANGLREHWKASDTVCERFARALESQRHCERSEKRCTATLESLAILLARVTGDARTTCVVGMRVPMKGDECDVSACEGLSNYVR